MSFPVTRLATRPAGANDRCYYCGRQIGQPHAADCVCIVKRVRVRMTVEFERYAPASWDRAMMEFHLNESSWCVDNAIVEIREYLKRRRRRRLCGIAKLEYLSDESAPVLREDR